MSKGFTLIEIVVAMGIVSGIILIVTMFSMDIFDFGIFLGDNLSAQRELQLTLRVMTSEIRAMASSANGSYAIESATADSLTFYSDIDGDGSTERIRYFLQGNILKKGIIKPIGNPLAYLSADEKISEQVHNIYNGTGNIFFYYNSVYSGSEPALSQPVDISAVRFIKADITVDKNPVDSKARVNFSTSVNIRNL